MEFNLELTDEMKKQLSSCTAIDIKKTFKYVPIAYKKQVDGKYVIPQEYWTVFDLRPLSGVEQQRIMDKCNKTTIDPLTGETKSELNNQEHILQVVKAGVLKWNFFLDQNFKMFAAWNPKFSFNGELTEEALGYLNPKVMEEIWFAIQFNLTLSDEEVLALK